MESKVNTGDAEVDKIPAMAVVIRLFVPPAKTSVSTTRKELFGKHHRSAVVVFADN
jgi:hypothetical protein